MLSSHRPAHQPRRRSRPSSSTLDYSPRACQRGHLAVVQCWMAGSTQTSAQPSSSLRFFGFFFHFLLSLEQIDEENLPRGRRHLFWSHRAHAFSRTTPEKWSMFPIESGILELEFRARTLEGGEWRRLGVADDVPRKMELGPRMGGRFLSKILVRTSFCIATARRPLFLVCFVLAPQC